MKSRHIIFAVLWVGLILNGCVNSNSITDLRDGKKYATVKIGEQLWMAENLNYNTGNSWCYDDDPVNCYAYGRLYTWETATKGCPAGWHLPTDVEWTQLIDYLGEEASKKMKSTARWNEGGKGTNKSGFSGLPGGARNYYGNFSSLGNYGYWWGATEADTHGAFYRGLSYANNIVNRYSAKKETGFSVRCVKD